VSAVLVLTHSPDGSSRASLLKFASKKDVRRQSFTGRNRLFPPFPINASMGKSLRQPRPARRDLKASWTVASIGDEGRPEGGHSAPCVTGA
jgi:hypothetical protein